MWDADLADVPNIKENNDGVCFLFVVIDHFPGMLEKSLLKTRKSTPFWKLLMKYLPKENQNSSGYRTSVETVENIRGCAVSPQGRNISQTYDCIALEYTIDLHRTRQDDQPISTSIAEAQMGATPFFVTSLVLALCSGVFSVLGTLQRNVKAIISAVLSILQGLCMAVGIILYITFINDEASHAKPDGGHFQYQYSWSIILVGLAFLASQSTAIVCVTLYLKRNAKKEDMVKIIPGLEDKVKDEPENVGVTNYSTPIF
ncbi:voltage-dependent calcium channel gamma-5 subunit-like [Ylistrum balloti]|uniref:voltage-dependent calcium channel gamma-5 subunit-like n=1 Tax=Ylistrum balloti TaxID=509963 RepID=UPI002905BE14|nr:voltage-dependent calcium channel gamma-5 subunit-like [Ylistrum balloti]